jgi:hypothetical protein
MTAAAHPARWRPHWRKDSMTQSTAISCSRKPRPEAVRRCACGARAEYRGRFGPVASDGVACVRCCALHTRMMRDAEREHRRLEREDDGTFRPLSPEQFAKRVEAVLTIPRVIARAACARPCTSPRARRRARRSRRTRRVARAGPSEPAPPPPRRRAPPSQRPRGRQ